MNDVQLSEDFWLSEFVRSDTARELGIDNTPDANAIERLGLLCVNVLQPTRDHLGVPLRITSGYRCPRLNEAVGGSRMSDHLFGQAADFVTVPHDLDALWKAGQFVQAALKFHQAIWEHDGAWLHVAYRSGQYHRRDVRQAIDLGEGRPTIYPPFTFGGRRP